jgi:hypothetical protein
MFRLMPVSVYPTNLVIILLFGRAFIHEQTWYALSLLADRAIATSKTWRLYADLLKKRALSFNWLHLVGMDFD